MKNSKIKYMTLNAMIAAIYATLVITAQPISFGVGPLSIRIADILLVLPWYDKKLSPGIVLGVVFANLASPLGVIDWVVGPLTTGLAIMVSNRMPTRWLVPLVQAIITGAIISLELLYVFQAPYLITFTSLFLSTLIICVVGILIFDLVKIEQLI